MILKLALLLILPVSLCAQGGMMPGPGRVIGGGGGGGTSYANTGGTGDRTGIITVTASPGMLDNTGTSLVNGNTSETVVAFIQQNNSGLFLRFDFGTAKVIDEAKFYQSASTVHNGFQWQGSADASSWTNIGSVFTLGGATTQTITALSGNTTAYRYYQIVGDGSGNVQDSPWLYEFEFKIGT